MEKIRFLTVPGIEAVKFILETDWSSDYSGYLLFAEDKGGNLHLVDVGSKVGMKAASSYLGELDTIVWACKCTKAYRGAVLLLIRIDNYGILDKSKSSEFYDGDIRSFRRWSWLIANEPRFRIEFFPSSENCGADLLSRPVKGPTMMTMKEKEVLEVYNVQWKEDEGQLRVIIKKLDVRTRIPCRKSEGAAVYDLYGIEEVTIPSGGRSLLKTGLAMVIPEGLYVRIAPRSGLVLSKGLSVGAGVIDSDYRGEIGVLLFNQGEDDVVIRIGDRIAQIIFERIAAPNTSK